jgi:hypothetical protein
MLSDARHAERRRPRVETTLSRVVRTVADLIHRTVSDLTPAALHHVPISITARARAQGVPSTSYRNFRREAQ